MKTLKVCFGMALLATLLSVALAAEIPTVAAASTSPQFVGQFCLQVGAELDCRIERQAVSTKSSGLWKDRKEYYFVGATSPTSVGTSPTFVILLHTFGGRDPQGMINLRPLKRDGGERLPFFKGWKKLDIEVQISGPLVKVTPKKPLPVGEDYVLFVEGSEDPETLFSVTFPEVASNK